MNILVGNEQEILQKGEAILIKHLGVSDAARFFSAWHRGSGNYLRIREKLFEGETVDTLYDKIAISEKELLTKNGHLQ